MSQTRPSTARGSRTQVVDYDKIPDLPFDDTDVSAFGMLNEHMTAPYSEAAVPAIALCSWVASHSGQGWGHAMRRRTTLLRQFGSNPASQNSTAEYRQAAPHMGSEAAVATSRLVSAEEQFLRLLAGAGTRPTEVADGVELAAAKFSTLPGCGKLEGGALAIQAAIQLRQSLGRDGTIRDRNLYRHSVATMIAAIRTLGTNYEADVSSILDKFEQIAQRDSHTSAATTNRTAVSV
jgi:hypothetical protein